MNSLFTKKKPKNRKTIKSHLPKNKHNQDTRSLIFFQTYRKFQQKR